ncbi:MAG: hypothetical protein M0R03_03660 [Novosphingobium sp.]|nr:hypothetical protein [Novosphingobium sp.]
MKDYNDSRDAVFAELYELMKEDESIVVLSGDTGAFMFQKYKEEFPNRFFNVGVAEQNMISVAAGLALAGKKPVVYGISNFVVLRCFEQIKLDICSMNLKVLILGTGTGYTYSYDGVTHHITEDVALMRTLPNMTILSPSDYNSAGMLLKHAILEEEGPCYLRFDKGPFRKKYNFSDKINPLYFHSGNSTAEYIIFSTGIMTDVALTLQQEYSQKRIDVIDIFKIKPFDVGSIYHLITRNYKLKMIIVLEEHIKEGGIGEMLERIIGEFSNVRMICFGLCKFVTDIGTRTELREKGGLRLSDIIGVLA